MSSLYTCFHQTPLCSSEPSAAHWCWCSHRGAFLRTGWGTWWSWWAPWLLSACPPAHCPSRSVYLRRQHTRHRHSQVVSEWCVENISSQSYKPRDAYVSFRSSLSMNPSRFWSMSVNAWIKNTNACLVTRWKLWVNLCWTSLHLFELLDLSLFKHGENVGRGSLSSFGASFLLLCLSARLKFQYIKIKARVIETLFMTK